MIGVDVGTTNIWNYFPNSKKQRAYTPDYEVYHGSDNAQIYIAVN